MVFLTMTDAIVAAIREHAQVASDWGHTADEEPPLEDPRVGNPISHTQLIRLSNDLKAHQRDSENAQLPGRKQWTMDVLLRGSEVYIPPAQPRTERTSEYKDLMARLKREEEARQYERMTNALNEDKSSIGVNSKPKPSTIRSSDQDEEMTFADVNRQVTLIINVLVTIIACGIAIWLVSYHWSAPKRLALSMGGSGLVGVAEVVIYAGYIRRLSEAKSKEKRKKEKKIIKNTWVIEKINRDDSLPMPAAIKETEQVRQRRSKP